MIYRTRGRLVTIWKIECLLEEFNLLRVYFMTKIDKSIHG